MEQTISPAAQILVSLIPIVGIACGAVVIFFALLWRHREVKLRILNNSYKPMNFNLRVFSLLTGLFLTMVGFVLSLMFILIHGISWAALGGLIPFATGLSLLIFYKVNPDFKEKKGSEDKN
ncbi:MAG: hypothetical protein IIU46_09180 [Treponema sp.]|nr:hypothetical protein [Treponema sp.]